MSLTVELAPACSTEYMTAALTSVAVGRTLSALAGLVRRPRRRD